MIARIVWGAHAAGVFISAACRKPPCHSQWPPVRRCRQAAGNYRLAACAFRSRNDRNIATGWPSRRTHGFATRRWM